MSSKLVKTTMGVAVCMLFLFPQRSQALGVGVIADSCCDEYRAEDNRGGTFAANTLNWVELLAKYRGWDFGSWGNWGDVRRSGYEYNWSRSGATTYTMISGGQHTGLAAQVAAGKVQMAFIFIGSNDFAPYRSDGYAPIYSGQLTGAALQAKLDGVYSNIITAFDTVQNAGTQKIAVIAVPDWGLSPNTASSFPDQIGRQRVSEALASLNSRINNYVTQNQGVYIDGNTLGSTLIDKLTPDGKLLIDGVEISMLTNGNDPHNFTLGDGIHSGTVAGGLIANLIMQEVGSPWNLNETPFTEVEMLTSAGLAAECYTCKTDIDQNGFADLSDFFLFTQDFLKASPANPRTDINGDGAVNLDDYSVVTSHFLTTCPV